MNDPPFSDHSRVSLWARVSLALSVALLPLGIVALIAGAHSYTNLRAAHARVGALQVLGVALPALMWIAAIAIAGISLHRLVNVPLRAMRRVVDRRAAGYLEARMASDPAGTSELAELAAAFNLMADRVAGHASAMEEALATQKALTREVHHRVKNNLQIVSSLISIQARDASNPDVAAAYALIRQRVNALALVHRWMYMDESARGVELRSLLADLSASLEHGFEGRTGTAGRVRCHAERISVGQDTALPIAFLVTELVAGARAHPGTVPADTLIEARRTADRVCCLSVGSPAFLGENGMGGFDESARRIVAGLARQLRSPLGFDADTRVFRICFPAIAVED